MTDAGTWGPRVVGGRNAAVRAALDGAWNLMMREGVAALSVRQLARDLGVRQQSLTYYFRTKQDLLNALFADGFEQLRPLLEAAGEGQEPRDRLEATVVALLEYCTSHPARYHLMLQRTVPGFTPSEASHHVALAALGVLLERLSAAGVSSPEDILAVRGLINGLAAEQIANDPGGSSYVRQARRALRALLAGLELHRPQEAPITEEVTMPIDGLHHVLLTVTDLARSSTFYEQVLGLRKVREIPDDGTAGAKVLFALPDGRLFGVVQHAASDGSVFDEMRTGLDHVAFAVDAEELDTWRRSLAEAGFPTSATGLSALGEPLIMVRDPDGIQVQIYGRLSREAPRAGQHTASVG